jgi:putative ABC transport system permease protein
MYNLRLALRTLFRTPFVTFVAVLSLALGIGANAAIYSLFDQMLLRPLPVPEPGRLVNLSGSEPNPVYQSCNIAGGCDVVFSYRMFRDLEAKNTVLSGLAGHFLFGVNLSWRNQPMSGQGNLVSGSYFPTLGLRPALGRLLTPDDDRGIGNGPVAVLSYEAWQARFGSDPGVLGQALSINGQTFSIVGVAPKGFAGTVLGRRPMVYLPLSMRGAVMPGWDEFENRRSYWVYAFGRLKPGVTLAQARAGLNAVYHPILTEVEAPLQQGMSDATMVKFKAKEVLVEPGAQGQSLLHGTSRTPLLLLFAVTGIVLLIACANIANLLLARGADRSAEMGIRLALGADRRQLLGQLLTESVLLALMGGAAGLLVAKGTLAGIVSMLPVQASGSLQFTLQPSVILFAAGVSLFTGLCFGLYPALHSTRYEVVDAIRASAGRISVGRGAARFRASLVTAQISLATMLLILAGLFLKSLVNISRVDLGLRLDDAVSFSLSPTRSGYDTTRAQQLFERLEERLSTTPGVTGVTSAALRLLAGDNLGTQVEVQGFPQGPDIDRNSRFDRIGPGYFATLGVHLVAGREFTAADRVGAPLVAVVNQTFARKFHLGPDAVGKFMSHHGMDSLEVQIVGIAEDVKYSEVKAPVPPVFYIPWRQEGSIGRLNFYVRTSDPARMLRTLPQIVKEIDPMLPVEELITMPGQVRENVFLDRIISILSAAFALLATLLAAVGLYGVLAYSVQQRTREIGVRMALGASAAAVRRMVLRQVGVLLAIGGLIGLGAALGIGQAAASLLFGLKGHDPMVFALSTLLLALVALGAGYLPARRASRVDPMQALRSE